MNRRLIVAAVALIAARAAQAQTTPATPAPAPAPAPSTPPARLPADSLAIARRYFDWLQTSRFDSLIAHMPAEGRPGLADIDNQWASFTARAGTEVELIAERWVRRSGRRQYWRVARYSDFTQENIVVRLVIMPDGSLGGMGMNPESRTPPIDTEP